MSTKKEITQLAERLRQINEWRRGADRPQPNPREFGRDIDLAIELLGQMSEHKEMVRCEICDEAEVLEKKGKDNATS